MSARWAESEEAWEDDWEEAWDEDEIDDEELEELRPQLDEGEWTLRGDAARFGLSSLSLGFLAMLPLFVAYELGARASGGRLRNGAELLLFQAFRPLPLDEGTVRVACLSAATVLALVVCFRRRVPLVPGVSRIVLEGIAAAVVLGPALAFSMRFFEGTVGRIPARPGPPAAPPELYEAALTFGGAAYEELLFRVAAYGLVFLLTRRILDFLGLPRGASGWTSEACAVLGSALFFAAFHLRTFTAWLGPGGEDFRADTFTWRLCAGILLALLFRWRGPGVAAWTHGLFNLALLLGAGPEVLL